jgi:hypothetical protein
MQHLGFATAASMLASMNVLVLLLRACFARATASVTMQECLMISLSRHDMNQCCDALRMVQLSTAGKGTTLCQ